MTTAPATATRLLALLLTSMLVPLPARAQEAVTSFEQLRGQLKQGDTIEVVDGTGRKHKGRVGELTASSLGLLIRQTGPDGRESWVAQPPVSALNVRTIRYERHDSVLNGALIGFAAGALPGALLIAGSQRGSDPVQDINTALSVTLVPGAIGAAIGSLVDAIRYERRTVFRAASPQSSRSVTPLLSPSTFGVRLALAF